MTEFEPATGELVAYVTKVRPDWDEQDLRVHIVLAEQNGWGRAKLDLAIVRLAYEPDSEPRDLREVQFQPNGLPAHPRRTA
jgi:hypothetical protein